MSWILSFHNWIKKSNKVLLYIVTPLFILSTSVAVSSTLKPLTITSDHNNNATQIGTSYDYMATITPNILYPEGGTIDVGDRIFKKIATAIPFNLTSIINSENEVTAIGTHELQLVVKAGELWERVFPLQEKQAFELKGTEISVIDDTFNIDLNEINSFIMQVEEETGIISDQYLFEVVPNIEGTVSVAGKEMPIPEQDNLVFQSSYEEIILISEKEFTSTIPFTTTDFITNTFNFFGTALPIGTVRIISTILSILLLLPTVYLYKNLLATRTKRVKTQADKINKKYGSRLIPVSQKINTDGKSTITLESFESIIRIADEKELPIFCHKVFKDGSAIYFIIDGGYIYHYETMKSVVIQKAEKGAESDEAYAKV